MIKQVGKAIYMNVNTSPQSKGEIISQYKMIGKTDGNTFIAKIYFVNANSHLSTAFTYTEYNISRNS